jgi:hypothetical protein
LFRLEQFHQAIYGNFALFQGGNLFRCREGIITEISEMSAGNPENFQAGRRKKSAGTPPSSHYFFSLYL